MKRFLISFFALFVCVIASAGNPLKITFGKSAFLKGNATALVKMDFTDTTWEETESFKEYNGEEHEQRLTTALDNFVISFNAQSPGLRMVKEGNDAKYNIVFKITNMERHQSFSGMWGQGKISVTGVIYVTNNETKEDVCTITVSKYGTGKDFSITDGIGKCFYGLGKEFAKLK